MKEMCPDVGGNDPSPYNQERLVHEQTVRVIDEVLGETLYRPDLDWVVYYKVIELEEQNGLPDGITAYDILDYFNRVFHHED